MTMKFTAKLCAASILSVSAFGATTAMAQQVLVNGLQPTATYTVCNHPAQFLVNPRARQLRAGARNVAVAATDPGLSATAGEGGVAVITRTPDVWLQTSRLVRNSYQSLSPDGVCTVN